MTMLRSLAALAFALAAVNVALAQTPAAPAATPPPSNCEKPDPYPGRLASTEKTRQWNREITKWQDCMKKYIGELQAKSDAAVKTANATVAESNAAIASFNEAVKEFQAQAEAAK